MDSQTKTILNQIESYLTTTQRGVRDKYALEEARRLVPIAELVQNNLDVLDGDYHDNLLPLVVNWFSNKFFTWFSVPDCEKCNGKLEFGSSFMNAMKLQVERYICCSETCDFNYDFIRHNDPAILLNTRRGRCGEWANCFLLILRALDYESRIVLDITDHVWNEVWSESKTRWVHVDPCEGAVDSPLLYEVGWSKKLVYCIAFSQFEVIDVTRRYSVDFKATKARRINYNDKLIQEHLDRINYQLIDPISDSKRSEVLGRRNIDIAFMKRLESEPRKQPDPKEYSMRKTGSLSWRMQRGEYTPKLKSGFVIQVLNSKNLVQASSDDLLFSLFYNSDINRYDCSQEEYRGKVSWDSLTYAYENLDFKYERDWRTSYLSRYETCPHDVIGKLQWRFDLSHVQEIWRKLEIFVSAEVYPDTSVALKIFYYAKGDTENQLEEANLILNTTNTVNRDNMKSDIALFEIVAELSGGEPEDEVCWQKPQLFRQTKGKNSQDWAFVVKIN